MRQSIEHDFTGDGRAEAIRVVHCRSGAGSPPHAVLAYTADPDGSPELLQTLLYDYDGYLVDELEVVPGGTIGGIAYGYSGPDVPRCCPDLEGQIQWRWAGSTFIMEAGPGL